ncbi:P22 coat protein Gp5 [Cupriavidus phytorum]|uniref:P22 coat protein Gp5 n=1 Tax=Cupriavidus phytorum TaxID=3024399 RepID=A0A2W7PB33_9BURK|nr:P22 phage major capsid protein family protein [Cupriavidus alkaliphilus]PZX29467.1 P22 coat protein Gp5 [Cupriavidus alkaliphilus]
MANALLTPTAVTRAALAILHQKLNFIGSINRQYDDSFAQSGAKIGDSLKIRLPNQYTVRTGATLSAQDTNENSVTLQMATQKGVDLNFTSVDLTLSLDDFKSRILEPAMSVLAANIEADAFSMALDVYNAVDNIGSAITLNKALQARKKLVDNLAPGDARTLILNTQDNLDLVDALKGLFQDSTEISKQYREGKVGRTAGFGTIYENTLLPSQATGTALSATTYTVNGAVTANGSSSVTVATGATTFKKGDVFTVAGCNRVHPETKADTGTLQQFVVTADYAGGAGSLSFAPAIYTSGGAQNVVAAGMANGASITKVGGASAVYKPSLAFHKDAFAFVSADLVMPQGVDFSARENYDGISMRIVRAYDINNDKFPCRLDVLYGYKTLRAQLAARILSN